MQETDAPLDVPNISQPRGEIYCHCGSFSAQSKELWGRRRARERQEFYRKNVRVQKDSKDGEMKGKLVGTKERTIHVRADRVERLPPCEFAGER